MRTSCFMALLAIAIFLVAALLVVAPHIGLGNREAFILYQHFGISGWSTVSQGTRIADLTFATINYSIFLQKQEQHDGWAWALNLAERGRCNTWL
jgi:hypothetical protein